MVLAASTHCGLRNGYLATVTSSLSAVTRCRGTIAVLLAGSPPTTRRPASLAVGWADAGGRRSGRASGDASAQPEVEARPVPHRDVGVHQLRHLHPTLSTSVRRHLQPRDRRDHRSRAVLRLWEVPGPLSRRLHLRGP